MVTDQAEIRQVVLWTNDSEPQFWTLSKWRPFANLQAARSTSLPTPVWSMLLHTVQQVLCNILHIYAHRVVQKNQIPSFIFGITLVIQHRF